jgi:hypothetical protein
MRLNRRRVRIRLRLRQRQNLQKEKVLSYHLDKPLAIFNIWVRGVGFEPPLQWRYVTRNSSFFSRIEFSSEEHLNAPDSGEYRLEAGKSGNRGHRKNFDQDFSSERFEVQLEAQMERRQCANLYHKELSPIRTRLTRDWSSLPNLKSCSVVNYWKCTPS